jgi:hypothetical protein
MKKQKQKRDNLFERVSRMPKIEQINELPNDQLFKLQEVADLMRLTRRAINKWALNHEEWFVIRHNAKRHTNRMSGSMIKKIAKLRAQQYRASHRTQKEADK